MNRDDWDQAVLLPFFWVCIIADSMLRGPIAISLLKNLSQIECRTLYSMEHIICRLIGPATNTSSNIAVCLAHLWNGFCRSVEITAHSMCLVQRTRIFKSKSDKLKWHTKKRYTSVQKKVVNPTSHSNTFMSRHLSVYYIRTRIVTRHPASFKYMSLFEVLTRNLDGIKARTPHLND